jgi:hypothetical protein
MHSLRPNADGDVGARLSTTENRMSAAIYTLAMYRAKKAVKEQLRRKGVKLSEVTARDIQILARLELDLRGPEFVAQGKEMIASSPELTKMYEKEQRQRAKLRTNAQSKIEPISITSAVQISGAK